MDKKSSHLIETNSLSVFQENSKILEEVNIKINSGEICYFIGKVGSGKTSLLKVLYAELPIKMGSAIVIDTELSKIKSSKIPLLRRKIGMVFQDFELLTDRSVYENLKFVLRATDWKREIAINERIDKVLTDVGMLNKKHSFPSKLSGGEKQCVSIARAMLNNPPIIFADEPTGNLDPESSTKIMDILYKLSKEDKAVVIVTHNYNILKKYPGRLYVFEDGKVNERIEEAIEID